MHNVKRFRSDFTLRCIQFKDSLQRHKFAFEIENPSFKKFHDAMHEDLELYRTAVGLGPNFVQDFYDEMQKRIRNQSEEQHRNIVSSLHLTESEKTSLS